LTVPVCFSFSISGRPPQHRTPRPFYFCVFPLFPPPSPTCRLSTDQYTEPFCVWPVSPPADPFLPRSRYAGVEVLVDHRPYTFYFCICSQMFTLPSPFSPLLFLCSTIKKVSFSTFILFTDDSTGLRGPKREVSFKPESASL